MATTKHTKDCLQDVPELLILRLFREREMSGYEIVLGIRTDNDSLPPTDRRTLDEKVAEWNRVTESIQSILDGTSGEPKRNQ